MYLSKSDFDKMACYKNHNNVRIKDDILYKRCHYEEEKKFLPDFKSIPYIEGMIKPISLLEDDNGIYGYTSLIVKNSVNVSEYLRSFSKVDYQKIVKLLFKTLKMIHKYMVIGDVRNSNILLTKDQVYFCDLDSGKLKDDERKLWCWSFVLLNDGKILRSTQLSDTIKTLFIALSILYHTNFEVLESPICPITIYEKLNILKELKIDKNIIEYLKVLLNDVENEASIPSIYFDDLIDSIQIPSHKERQNVSRTLRKF